MTNSPFGELEQRSPRRAGIPESRRGARTGLVAIPATQTDAEAPAASEPPQTAKAKQKPAPEASVSAQVDELVKTTLHLSSSDDALLNLVSYTGKKASPKVEASRSAVVRLALRHLAETMTPDQIVAELRSSAVSSGSAGRPRLR